MTKAIQQEALTAVLARRWQQACQKLEQLADALPAGQMDSRPVDGTRTAAEVLRHVAFWNQYVADTLRGKPADDTGNELPAEKYSTKASIIEALQRSAEDVAGALREQPTPPDSKTVELIMSFVEHVSEHYGQLVVYTRLKGIVPPASR
jgi:uncharacterized damage-inducible protein DinB